MRKRKRRKRKKMAPEHQDYLQLFYENLDDFIHARFGENVTAREVGGLIMRHPYSNIAIYTPPGIPTKTSGQIETLLRLHKNDRRMLAYFKNIGKTIDLSSINDFSIL